MVESGMMLYPNEDGESQSYQDIARNGVRPILRGPTPRQPPRCGHRYYAIGIPDIPMMREVFAAGRMFLLRREEIDANGFYLALPTRADQGNPR